MELFTQLLCLLVTDAVIKGPVIHRGKWERLSVVDIVVLRTSLARSLFHWIICLSLMKGCIFFLKSTGRYLTICFCIYLNSGEILFSSNINSFSEIQFFFLVFIFFFRDRVLCAVITFVDLNLKTRLASDSDIKHSLLLGHGI